MDVLRKTVVIFYYRFVSVYDWELCFSVADNQLISKISFQSLFHEKSFGSIKNNKLLYKNWWYVKFLWICEKLIVNIKNMQIEFLCFWLSWEKMSKLGFSRESDVSIRFGHALISTLKSIFLASFWSLRLSAPKNRTKFAKIDPPYWAHKIISYTYRENKNNMPSLRMKAVCFSLLLI